MKTTPLTPPSLIDCNEAMVSSVPLAKQVEHCISAKSVYFRLAANQVFLNHDMFADDEDFLQQWYTDEDYDQFEREYEKTVRFDMASTHIYVIDGYSPETVHLRWYSECDYEGFRQCLRRDSRAVYRDQSYHSYREALSQMFAACCRYNAKCRMTDADTEMLRTVFRQIRDRSETLGLDKFCVKSLFVDKLVRRRELYAFVLSQQDEISRGSEPRGLCMDSEIRQRSEEISRPSCLYARLMAQAIADPDYRN